MKEIEFTPEMQRLTDNELSKLYFDTWKRDGVYMNDVVEIVNAVSGKLVFVISAELMTPEVLSLLEQEYNSKLRAAGIGQGWTHNPSVEVSASETPATSEVADVEVEGQRNEGLHKGNAEADRGQDE